MSESLKIPQIIEGGIPSYDSMWGNAVVPIAKSMITNYASNMMRQALYGSRLLESRELAADLADITSFSKAASLWKDPDLLEKSIEELMNLSTEYGKSGQNIRQTYADANVRLMEPYLDTLQKQKEVRGIRDDMEDKLKDLLKEQSNWVGKDPAALKVLDVFQDKIDDLAAYHDARLVTSLNDIENDMAYAISGHQMLTSLDDEQEIDGIQIHRESFPTSESYDNAVYIKDKINASLAGGLVHGQGIREANALMKSLQTELRVADNKELRTKNTIRGQMSNDIDNWLTVLDTSYPDSDDLRQDMFGSTLGGVEPTKGLLTNLRGLVAGKNEVSPNNFAFLNNIALREMAKIVLVAGKVPEKIKKSAKEWQSVGLNEHDTLMAGNFYKQIAHWEKDAFGMSSAAKGWDTKYMSEEMMGLIESDKDENIRDLAIRWNSFLEELYKMRIQASELFPEQQGWLEGIGAQNIQPTYGSALEQALKQ